MRHKMGITSKELMILLPPRFFLDFWHSPRK